MGPYVKYLMRGFVPERVHIYSVVQGLLRIFCPGQFVVYGSFLWRLIDVQIICMFRD